MLARFHATIYGKVQGVFFRAKAKQAAEFFNVSGNVTNLADGSVALNAQGNLDSLKRLLKWCQYGPKAANVAMLRVEWTKPSADSDSKFSII